MSVKLDDRVKRAPPRFSGKHLIGVQAYPDAVMIEGNEQADLPGGAASR